MDIHRQYLQAGADLIRTNTFAANSQVFPMLSATERKELHRKRQLQKYYSSLDGLDSQKGRKSAIP